MLQSIIPSVQIALFAFILVDSSSVFVKLVHIDQTKLKYIASDFPSVKIHSRYSLWPSLKYNNPKIFPATQPNITTSWISKLLILLKSLVDS